MNFVSQTIDIVRNRIHSRVDRDVFRVDHCGEGFTFAAGIIGFVAIRHCEITVHAVLVDAIAADFHPAIAAYAHRPLVHALTGFDARTTSPHAGPSLENVPVRDS